VLLDADMTPKIGDFGSSRINCKCYFGPDAQEGTFPWESPELWLSDEENPRTYQSDIWAFGCVALEVGWSELVHPNAFSFKAQIQMGMTPWDPDHEGNLWRMRNRQLRARGRCPADEHNLSLGQHPILGEVWGLMRRSWRENPVERPTAAELLDEFELLNDQLNEATAG
jgi:serine/threonine protein kinase